MSTNFRLELIEPSAREIFFIREKSRDKWGEEMTTWLIPSEMWNSIRAQKNVDTQPLSQKPLQAQISGLDTLYLFDYHQSQCWQKETSLNHPAIMSEKHRHGFQWRLLWQCSTMFVLSEYFEPAKTTEALHTFLMYRAFIKYCVFSSTFCNFSELWPCCCSAGVQPAWCV